MANPVVTKEMGNITRVIPVDVSVNDFTDENGFFIRCDTDGDIRYCPIGNLDSEAITKAISASATFNDPEICRKIFAAGTDASEIYIGYGV